MAEAQVTTTSSHTSQIHEDQGLAFLDMRILQDKFVILSDELQVDTVLAGLRPFLKNQSYVDTINAAGDRGAKIRELYKLLQRLSVKENKFELFNKFMKIVSGTQRDLFCKLVGRKPSESEADFCVEGYVEKLKTNTQDQGHSIDSLLDEKIDFDLEYVQLEIVREKSDSETCEEVAHRNETDPSKAQDRDDNVPVVDVLACDDNEKKPKHILLKGRAGTGKSTKCQWLARQWSFNRWAADFTLIFLLQLRMLSIIGCEVTAIELLTLHSLYRVQETDLVCLVSSWLKHSGAKLMILLDGLDEISGFSSRLNHCKKITDLNQKAQPIDICINILRGNLLPGSTILSVSRSFAGLSAVQFDKEFEILELTESRVTEFVNRKHPDKAAHILSVLKNNPLLMSICGITFYCVLISRLLAEGVVFDHVELQTYTRLTAFIVVQCVSREVSDWPFVVQVSSYFPKLAGLAYNGLFEAQLRNQVSKLVFDEYDLSKAELTPERLEAVRKAGLLQTKRVQVGARSSVIAEFIHSSVQEMLASTHLSQFPPSSNIFSQMFSGGQFHMALLYLFGIQYDTASDWIKDIRHAVNPCGEGISSFPVQQMDEFIQDLCEKCDEQSGFRSRLQVCQLLHEGQMEDKAKSVVAHIVPNGKLEIKYTQMTLIDLMAVWFVCKHAKITEVSIKKCGLTDTHLGFLTSSLQEHSVELSVLDLRDNDIGPGGAKAIAKWLGQNRALHTLYIYGNNIGDEGARDIAAELSHNHTLQTLDVGMNNIGQNGAKDIAEALKNNTTLELLTVSFNKFGEAEKKALNARKREGLTIK